jgi:hypothetical protein
MRRLQRCLCLCRSSCSPDCWMYLSFARWSVAAAVVVVVMLLLLLPMLLLLLLLLLSLLPLLVLLLQLLLLLLLLLLFVAAAGALECSLLLVHVHVVVYLCHKAVTFSLRGTAFCGTFQPYKVSQTAGAAHHLLFREVVIDASPIIVNLSYDLMMRLSSFLARATRGLSGAFQLSLAGCVIDPPSPSLCPGESRSHLSLARPCPRAHWYPGADSLETSTPSSATIHPIAKSFVPECERVLRDAQTAKPAFARSDDPSADKGEIWDRVVYFRALRIGQIEVSLNYVAGSDQDHLDSMHLFPGVVQVSLPSRRRFDVLSCTAM